VSRAELAALGVFGLVTGLGLDGGGYAPTSWGWATVAVFAVLAVLLTRGAPRPRAAALLLVGGLAAFAAWSALSAAWSADPDATVLEVERLLLYVGSAAVFVLCAGRGRLLAGAFGAIVLVCGYGLGQWLFGSPETPLVDDPQVAQRLADPIGYANGLGILAAMGLLLAAGLAARAGRDHATLAAAAVPLLATTLYFTYSRGAWLALGAGLAFGIALGPGRLQLAATALLLAVPAAVGVAAAAGLGASGWVALLVVLLGGLTAAVARLARDVE
jgi:hypothetical protein